jgi:hypothetical protein
MLDGIPADENLAKTANKTASAAKRTKDLITRVTSELNRKEIWDRIRSFRIPPGYDEVFNDQAMVDIMPQLEEIVDRYREGEVNPMTIDQDILRFAAYLFYFAGKTNHLEGLALDAETTHKQAYERTIIEAKTIEDDSGARLTKELVEAIASTQVEDRREYYILAKIISHTMKGFYFAAKDMLEVMNSVSMRVFKERTLGAHQ